MKITENLSMTKRARDGAFYGEKDGRSYVIDNTNELYQEYASFYNSMRTTNFDTRAQAVQELMDAGMYPDILGVKDGPSPKKVTSALSKEERLINGLKGLMDFFTEFSFTPSFRFTNTFAFKLQNSTEDACKYVSNYFSLMDSSYKKEIEQKLQSAEFKKIMDNVQQYGEPDMTVNKRLKIYFGSAGTGKTTIAQKEADNRCIVCNSSMLPADLMEDFIFKDGNPDFNPSLLWECMEQGKTIVLDEINLLPFDSLRFLQGLVDGKTEFFYKNRPVHIHEGFQIIGTMNLTLGGMTYGLPEPLVDRCCDIKEFVLTAQQLAKAITGIKDGVITE